MSDIYISRLYYDVSVRLSVTQVHWVAVHAGNTAAAPASEVKAIIRSPKMSAADVAAVEGRGHLALCQPLLGPLVEFCEQTHHSTHHNLKFINFCYV